MPGAPSSYPAPSRDRAITGRAGTRNGRSQILVKKSSFPGPPSRVDLIENEILGGNRRLSAAALHPPHGHAGDHKKRRQESGQEYQDLPCPAESLSGMQSMLPSQYSLSDAELTGVEHLDHTARPWVDKDRDRRRASLLTGAQEANAKGLIGRAWAETQNRARRRERWPAPIRAHHRRRMARRRQSARPGPRRLSPAGREPAGPDRRRFSMVAGNAR